MEPCNLVSSPEYLVSNGRRALLGGIRLCGSATFGEDEEPAKHTILFIIETARTPLPGAPTVDRISSTVLLGVYHKGRLIGGGARNQEQEDNIDTRVRQVWVVSTT